MYMRPNSYSYDRNVRTCSIIRTRDFFLNLLMSRMLCGNGWEYKVNNTDRAQDAKEGQLSSQKWTL